MRGADGHRACFAVSRSAPCLHQQEGLEGSKLQLQHQAALAADLTAYKKKRWRSVASLHSNLFAGDSMEALRHLQLLAEHAAAVHKMQKRAGGQGLCPPSSQGLQRRPAGESIVRRQSG